VLVLAAAALLALPVAGCSDDGNGVGTARREPVTGSFVGMVAGSDAYVAIVVGPNGDAHAYVTDGAWSVDWLEGMRRGDAAQLSNQGGATLDAKFGRGSVTGSFTRPQSRTLTFTALSARAPAGLYRARADFADGLYVGGWVVLPDGTKRGTVRRYETPLAPGEVDATAFTPGDESFTVPGGVLRPDLVRPSADLSLPS
jgi:hypothetical protein